MSGQQAPGEMTRRAMETLELTIKGAKAYEREDLVERLVAARHLLSTPSVLVYVVGEFKQGKSSLINALLTAEICAVDDDIATAVPTVVQYAERPAAEATFLTGDGGQTRVEPVTTEVATRLACEGGAVPSVRAERLRSVRIGVKRRLLADGLVLVDTPGVGGLGSVHTTVTVGALPQAHAVLFVSDASQELTAAEIKFLRTAQELCPTVLFALTKTDLHVDWRRIMTLNEGHLRDHGIRTEQVPVSSELRMLAAPAADQAMNTESGFPALVARLHEVTAEAEQLSLRAAGNHVLSVVEQLEATLRARETALVHPERTAQLTAELNRARERLEQLKARSARWQQLLFDGFADIGSNIDHDLRTRARGVLTDAETAIEDGDPAKNFDEFGAWLRQRLAGETMDNYADLIRQSRELAVKVAEHFELAESTVLPPTLAQAPVATVEAIDMDTSFAKASKLGSTGMAGLQKGYMGLIMFTLLTGMAGLHLPIAVGVGVAALMGRGGAMDDRKRQLEQRRSRAKLAVRKFVDEFNSHVGKDSRDALRRIQREIRDGYTQRIDELLRSLTDAAVEAEKAVRGDQSDGQQLQRIENDLRSLAMLRAQAGELMGLAAPPARAAVGARPAGAALVRR